MPSEFDVINSFAMPSSPLSYATARLCVKRMDEEDAIYLQNSFSPRNCLQSTKLRWPESKFCSLVQPCRMELERPSSQRDLVAFNLALFLLHYHVVKDGFTLVALPWIIPGALHSRQTFDCWTWWQNCTRGSFACSGIVDGIYTQQGSQAVNENCLIRAKLNQVLYDFSFEGVSSADIPRTGAATRFVGFFLRAQVVGVIGWSGQQIRMLAAVGLRNIASIQLLTGRFKNQNLTRITLQTQIETWKIPWSWSWRICKAGEKGDLIVTLICEESWIFFQNTILTHQGSISRPRRSSSVAISSKWWNPFPQILRWSSLKYPWVKCPSEVWCWTHPFWRVFEASFERFAWWTYSRFSCWLQVCSQTFYEPCPAPPSELHRRIRDRNPSPFSFLINLGDSEYLVRPVSICPDGSIEW